MSLLLNLGKKVLGYNQPETKEEENITNLVGNKHKLSAQEARQGQPLPKKTHKQQHSQKGKPIINDPTSDRVRQRYEKFLADGGKNNAEVVEGMKHTFDKDIAKAIKDDIISTPYIAYMEEMLGRNYVNDVLKEHLSQQNLNYLREAVMKYEPIVAQNREEDFSRAEIRRRKEQKYKEPLESELPSFNDEDAKQEELSNLSQTVPLGTQTQSDNLHLEQSQQQPLVPSQTQALNLDVNSQPFPSQPSQDTYNPFDAPSSQEQQENYENQQQPPSTQDILQQHFENVEDAPVYEKQIIQQQLQPPPLSSSQNLPSTQDIITDEHGDINDLPVYTKPAVQPVVQQQAENLSALDKIAQQQHVPIQQRFKNNPPQQQQMPAQSSTGVTNIFYQGATNPPVQQAPIQQQSLPPPIQQNKPPTFNDEEEEDDDDDNQPIPPEIEDPEQPDTEDELMDYVDEEAEEQKRKEEEQKKEEEKKQEEEKKKQEEEKQLQERKAKYLKEQKEKYEEIDELVKFYQSKFDELLADQVPGIKLKFTNYWDTKHGKPEGEPLEAKEAYDTYEKAKHVLTKQWDALRKILDKNGIDMREPDLQLYQHFKDPLKLTLPIVDQPWFNDYELASDEKTHAILKDRLRSLAKRHNKKEKIKQVNQDLAKEFKGLTTLDPTEEELKDLPQHVDRIKQRVNGDTDVNRLGKVIKQLQDKFGERIFKSATKQNHMTADEYWNNFRKDFNNPDERSIVSKRLPGLVDAVGIEYNTKQKDILEKARQQNVLADVKEEFNKPEWQIGPHSTLKDLLDKYTDLEKFETNQLPTSSQSRKQVVENFLKKNNEYRQIYKQDFKATDSVNETSTSDIKNWSEDIDSKINYYKTEKKSFDEESKTFISEFNNLKSKVKDMTYDQLGTNFPKDLYDALQSKTPESVLKHYLEKNGGDPTKASLSLAKGIKTMSEGTAALLLRNKQAKEREQYQARLETDSLLDQIKKANPKYNPVNKPGNYEDLEKSRLFIQELRKEQSKLESERNQLLNKFKEEKMSALHNNVPDTAFNEFNLDTASNDDLKKFIETISVKVNSLKKQNLLKDANDYRQEISKYVALNNKFGSKNISANLNVYGDDKEKLSKELEKQMNIFNDIQEKQKEIIRDSLQSFAEYESKNHFLQNKVPLDVSPNQLFKAENINQLYELQSKINAAVIKASSQEEAERHDKDNLYKQQEKQAFYTHQQQIKKDYNDLKKQIVNNELTFKKLESDRTKEHRAEQLKQAANQHKSNIELRNKMIQDQSKARQEKLSHERSMVKLQDLLGERAESRAQKFHWQKIAHDKKEKQNLDTRSIEAQQKDVDRLVQELNDNGVTTAPVTVLNPQQGQAELNNLNRQFQQIPKVKKARQDLEKLVDWFDVHPLNQAEVLEPLPSKEEIRKMTADEAEKEYLKFDRYRLKGNVEKKLQEQRYHWGKKLNSLEKDIARMNGDYIEENYSMKNAPESLEEFERLEQKLTQHKEQTEDNLKDLNRQKYQLISQIKEARKDMTPESTRYRPSLAAFEGHVQGPQKYTVGKINKVEQEVDQLKKILDDDKMFVEMEHTGRVAGNQIDAYLESMRTLTGDPSLLYKVLKDAGNGTADEVKIDPGDYHEFQKKADSIFELGAKTTLLPGARQNMYRVQDIVNSAKEMWFDTDAHKHLGTNWDQVAHALKNESENRKSATVESLARSRALSEVYLISLALDATQHKDLSKENPVKLYTALKSFDVKVNTTDLKGKDQETQVKELLKQVPENLYKNAMMQKIANEIDTNESSWRRQLMGSADSYSNEYIREHLITGNSKQDAINNIMKAPGYRPGVPLSRLDFGTGNFYPVPSLSKVQRGEAYFINKPKDLKSLHGLKKDRILTSSNRKEISIPAIAFGNDKLRRSMTGNLRPNSRYLNLAQFINSLPGSNKDFKLRKEKFIKKLQGADQVKPKRKHVTKELVEKKNKRKINKRKKGKPIKKKGKGGELDDTDDDDLYLDSD